MAAALLGAPAPAGAQVHDRTAPPAAEEPSPAVDLSLVYTAEAFGNVRGGLRRGVRYLDNLDATLTIDAERAWGWRGATLFAYGLYNNGARFAETHVGAAQGVSNIETGIRAARLYEAWAEQRFAAGRASVKVGLYDLNSEFDAIETAALFLNPSHGIGPDFSQSGGNGPSIFPSTSLAVRADYRFGERWTLRAAVLDGVPGDPDRPARTAIKLGGGDGALVVGEVNHAAGGTRVGLGYWRYTGRLDDLRKGRSRRRGNSGAYMFAERRLLREASDEGQGLAGWVCFGVADAAANPIGRYGGGGLVYTGPFAGRDEDQAGFAIGAARFGRPYRRSLAGSDPDTHEVIVEATYRAPVASWLTLQPDVQYVVNPGGERATRDALVVGLRAEIGF